MGLACQACFFLNEIAQLAATNGSLKEYLSEIWNWNDATCGAMYLATVISVWAKTTDDMTGEDIATIKVLYCIVIVQTFFKLLFLLRIYDEVGLLIRVTASMLQSVRPFFVFAFSINLLFALLFMVAGIELPVQYSYGWNGFKWIAFSLRNALGDFELHPAKGFLPDSLTGKVLTGDFSDDVYGDGRGTILNLTWIIWFFNVIVMSVMLVALLLALVNQSYE